MVSQTLAYQHSAIYHLYSLPVHFGLDFGGFSLLQLALRPFVLHKLVWPAFPMCFPQFVFAVLRQVVEQLCIHIKYFYSKNEFMGKICS